MTLAHASALGVDPGLAHTGLAIVTETDRGVFHIVHLGCVKTTKGQDRDVRIVDDDGRRLVEIHKAVTRVIADHAPGMVGIETYAPRTGLQGNGAHKVVAVYGLVAGLALSANRPVFGATPQDIRRTLLGKSGGTKQAVAGAVHVLCPGMAAALAKRPKAEHEHIIDAVAHAIHALESTRAARRIAFRRSSQR